MTYLVTGATGNIGGRVLDRLLAKGARPRVFARDAEKARARFGDRVDVAVGDLSDPPPLARALGGIDALFLVNAGADLAARDKGAAEVAKSAGVSLVVKLSTYDVAQEAGIGVWHAAGKAAIRASGVGFVFVQPSLHLGSIDQIGTRRPLRRSRRQNSIHSLRRHRGRCRRMHDDTPVRRRGFADNRPRSAEFRRDDREGRRRDRQAAALPADL